MANIKILNTSGEDVGSLELAASVFGVEVNKSVVFDAIQVYRSNSRQGTSSTKTRDMVRGGGRKPWRQKGTGRARQGSIRSPQWRGGGIVFGPTPNKNYKIKQNKKERKLALKSVLTQKVIDDEVMIIDSIIFDNYSTKQFISVLNVLELTDKVTYIIYDIEDVNEQAFRSSLNLIDVAFIHHSELNVYDIVRCDKLVFTKGALEAVQEVLANG